MKRPVALPRRFLITALMFLMLLALAGCQTQPGNPAPAASESPLKGQALDSAPLSTQSPTSGPKGTREMPDDPSERAKLAADVPTAKGRRGYQSVAFEQLAGFDYGVDPEGRLRPDAKLPAEIKALDNTPIALSGYMIPLEIESDRVATLMLVRNQLLCCFGQEPKLNEWVFVLAQPPVELVTDVPVTLYGVLEAYPDLENGQVLSLYRMLAEEMEVAR